MNWVDIIILVILLAFIAFGFYKGFIFSILSLFGTFINFVIAIVLTKPVSILLNNWFKLQPAIDKSLTSKLSNMHEGFDTNLIGMDDKAINKHISSTLKDSDLPFTKLFDKLINVKGESISNKTQLTLNDILSESLSKFFTLVISFTIIFLLIYLVLFLISLITKKLHEIETIRITDRILGVVFGAVKGCLTIMFIIAILSLFKENGIFESVISYIKDSSIGGFAYKHINLFVDKYITLTNVVKTIKS